MAVGVWASALTLQADIYEYTRSVSALAGTALSYLRRPFDLRRLIFALASNTAQTAAVSSLAWPLFSAAA